MSALIIALVTLAIFIAIVTVTIRDIYDDGYGRRPSPPSHHADPFEPSRNARMP